MIRMKSLWLPVLSMALVIVASNVLMAYPINDWLVWGALTYPLAFLVTDMTNRQLGAASARTVVIIGFVIGVLASLYFAEVRIALASGAAFLVAQLLDITVFNWLRRQFWWVAPLVSSVFSTVIDTVLFYGLAFYGTAQPWIAWATGDLGVKWAVAVLALIPYGILIAWRPSAATSTAD